MKRRFVIAIDALDAEQENEFRKYIASKGSWWHWIDNLWLMTTKSDAVSAEEIRDKIKELNPKARILVFEFPEDITWSATRSQNAKGKTMTEWLRVSWGARDDDN